jgi:hypothetical protein
MTALEVYGIEQSDRWLDALDRTSRYDFYHLPQYHALAERRGEGQARLYVYREAEYTLALPLLLRPIACLDGLEEAGEGWMDATSVYGYAGPVASHADVPAEVLEGFQTALSAALAEQRVVALFSRLHPLLSQSELLSSLGERITLGPTISIDLTLPVEEQRARYRRGHKSDLNRLRRQGVICELDAERAHLAEFVDIYTETMHHVDAAERYFFDRAYFERLFSLLDGQMHLFVCQLEDEVICAGLFSLCCGIVQAHLGGTRDAYRRLAPAKLMYDAARLWGTEQGARVFHLGGGVGSQRDSLYRFKSGFSDREHNFGVWQWVLVPDIYARLCSARACWQRDHGQSCASGDFFPSYRTPTQ